MLVTAGSAQAEALQPDPAWKQGTLANGFQWQILATPQRPSDRIEIRLLINSGSLNENTQQSGFSHLISRLALSQNGRVPAQQAHALWQQSLIPDHAYPPAVVSYNSTLFSLSLPNDRSDLLKEALNWLSILGGELVVTPDTVSRALQRDDQVTTWPADTKEGWWPYRLKGSPMLVHDPAAALKTPVDSSQLAAFYQQWYTPDAITLIVVGNVDSRSVVEQINKSFGELKGKRETPAAVPVLAPLPTKPVNIMSREIHKDKLSIMWDAPWLPIKDSDALQRYWRNELAHEALFWHIQQSLGKKNIKDVNLSFDCRVVYQRAQCAINIESPAGKLNNNLTTITRELVAIRDEGLPQGEFDALIARKTLELQKLFATYGRTSTDILMSQRLRSLQNQVVDISPELYQKLRQKFLNALTVEMLNHYLHALLSQEMALVLQQCQGEAEYDMKDLNATWETLMTPVPAHHDDVSDKQNNPPYSASVQR